MSISQKSTARIRSRPGKIEISDLRSDAYDVVEFYKNHQAVDDALPLDFSSTIALAKALPVGLRGEEHRTMRLELAKVLAKGKTRLVKKLPALVAEHFKLLDQPGRHDLLRSACRPFADACLGLLSGLSLDSGLTRNLSDIFDPGAGVARRRRLEADVRSFFHAIGVSADSEEGVNALAVAVMGRDPLLGTIALSLHQHMSVCQNEAMNSRPFSKVPTDTGVPYVWRIGTTDDANTYECRFDQLSTADDAERIKFFGAGAHTCLGKNHTLLIFKALSDYMSERTRTVVSSAISTEKQHVLTVPSEFFVEVK